MTSKSPSLREQFNLTYAELTILINALNKLIKMAQAGKIRHTFEGICWNWKRQLPWPTDSERRKFSFPGKDGSIEQGDAFDLCIALTASFAMTWKHSLRRGEYMTNPVPYIYGHHLWEGQNLDFRIDLMRYMVKRLRDWRRRTPIKTSRR